MGPTKLIDGWGRHIDYLRISVTDRCNLNCIYCRPQGTISKLKHRDILKYEEILRIINIGVGLGISKVRVTGGEPLLRRNINSFLEQLTRIQGLTDISLTTNGIFLKKHLKAIYAAGIKRINISLDTLDPLKFKKITGFNGFDLVWESILAAHRIGFNPIKINVVAIPGLNTDELEEIARLSMQYPFHIRFIELMPCIKNQTQLLGPAILERLKTIGELQIIKTNRAANCHLYQYKNGIGKIGIICPVSNHFCKTCNRLRLTASGDLRPCLLSKRHENLKDLIRSNQSDRAIAAIFLKAVGLKPRKHNLNKSSFLHEMSAIGG